MYFAASFYTPVTVILRQTLHGRYRTVSIQSSPNGQCEVKLQQHNLGTDHRMALYYGVISCFDLILPSSRWAISFEQTSNTHCRADNLQSY
jgi:hypothetical protein